MTQIQLPKNIIKMFNNIQINGIDYKTEETAVSPSAQQILAENRESAQNILQSSIEQEIGQEVKAVELNETLHNVKDELARNNILKEVSTRAREITRVEGLIESEASTRASTDATLNNNINTINSKIPSQASKTNQLADKDFVNSSIATNTANFIGTFTDIEELKRQPATNNDYAFWLTTDSAGNILFKRYKYIASTSSWVFEYDLNNSSFTSEQWLAIQSGITAVLVAKLKGIEEGAQVNTITGVKGGNESSYRTGNVNITKDNVGLGNVVNTGDSATPKSGGTTKFTTGGAYTELAKKNDKITITDQTTDTTTIGDTTKLVLNPNQHSNPTTFVVQTALKMYNYIKGKLDSVFVPLTRKVNGHALSSDVTVTKSDVGLGSVVNTGDSATPKSGGTTKFTTGGAYTELAKKNDKITITDDSSTALTDADTFSTTSNTGTNPTNLTKRPLSLLWTYIKGKADSVYAKLSHTHDDRYFRTTGIYVDPTEFGSWMNTNGSYLDETTSTWRGSVYTFYAGSSQSGLMFRIRGGSGGASQVDMNYSIDSNRFGMGWATIINSQNIGKQPVVGSAPYIDTLDIAISSEVRVTMNTFTSNAINAPVATDGLVITHHLSSTKATQLALCGAKLFTRTYSNSTWSAWTAMWNTEES